MTPDKWKWFGHAGHLCVGRWCRFHLCTDVGKYLVSTVGEYWPLRPVREIHDPKWLAENKHLMGDAFDAAYMEKFGFEEVGCDRKYETYVFKKTTGKCANLKCLCDMPNVDWSEVDGIGANAAGDAAKNHVKYCKKWSRK